MNTVQLTEDITQKLLEAHGWNNSTDPTTDLETLRKLLLKPEALDENSPITKSEIRAIYALAAQAFINSTQQKGSGMYQDIYQIYADIYNKFVFKSLKKGIILTSDNLTQTLTKEQLPKGLYFVAINGAGGGGGSNGRYNYGSAGGLTSFADFISITGGAGGGGYSGSGGGGSLIISKNISLINKANEQEPHIINSPTESGGGAGGSGNASENWGSGSRGGGGSGGAGGTGGRGGGAGGAGGGRVHFIHLYLDSVQQIIVLGRGGSGAAGGDYGGGGGGTNAGITLMHIEGT